MPRNSTSVFAWRAPIGWRSRRGERRSGRQRARLLLGDAPAARCTAARRVARAQRSQLGDRLRADAAAGHVDDAREADDVERVVDEAQVREHVLHLAPLVEARAADELVAGCVARMNASSSARDCAFVRYITAMSPRRMPLCRQRRDLVRDEVGLFLLVVGLVHDDRLARALLGPERSSACAACCRR